jgi:catechol 2,3-dioxygenase-like lactoylglutathione lyase family enzyme
MRISHVRIWVDDMAVARRFYGETLGLASPWSWGDASMGFTIGDAQLIVEPDDGTHEGETLAGRFTGATIEVDDIDATYAEWTAKGVHFDGPPEDAPGIGAMTFFKDPARNTFTLYARRRMARLVRAPAK